MAHPFNRDKFAVGKWHRYLLNFLQFGTKFCRIPHLNVEPALAFVQLTGNLSANSGFNYRLHIVHIQAKRSKRFTINFNRQVRLPDRLLHKKVGRSRHFRNDSGNILTNLIELIKIFAVNFYCQIRLYSTGQFVNAHGNRLRKIVRQSGFRLQERFNLRQNIFFRNPIAPFVGWLQHHPNIGLVHAHPVVGQVGSTGFRNHGLYLRNIFHQLSAQPVGIVHRLFQGDRWHANLLNQNRTFIQFRKKLGSKAAHHNHRQTKNDCCRNTHKFASIQIFVQSAVIAWFDPIDQVIPANFYTLPENNGRDGRYKN